MVQSRNSRDTFCFRATKSLSAGRLIMVFAVSVYDSPHTVIGVLAAAVDGFWLSEQIKDIVVGNTGDAYINGTTGTAIADPETVASMWNTQEK